MRDTDPTPALPPGEAAPPPPPPPAPRPPLRRPRHDRLLSGVAAGLARHFGLDVTVVRVLLVLGVFLTQGLVLFGYLVATLLIPAGEEPVEGRPGEERSPGRRGASFWVGVVLLLVGILWLLDGPIGPPLLFAGLGSDTVWALVLIAFGVALWRGGEDRPTRQGRDHGSPPRPTPAAPHAGAAGAPEASAFTPATTTPDLERSSEMDDTLALPRPTDPPHADTVPIGESPRRRPSLLTRSTIGAALVLAGGLWSLRLADVLQVGFVQIVAAALAVVGVGLLIGSVAGRGRGLILAGALLTPFVLGAELLTPLPVIGFDGIGADARSVVERPATAAELESEYELEAGRFALDLRGLELQGTTSVEVQVGAGELEVVLPENATVEVNAQAGVGQVEFDGRSNGGVAIDRSETIVVGDGSEELELDLRVGIGEVVVRQP